MQFKASQEDFEALSAIDKLYVDELAADIFEDYRHSDMTAEEILTEMGSQLSSILDVDEVDAKRMIGNAILYYADIKDVYQEETKELR